MCASPIGGHRRVGRGRARDRGVGQHAADHDGRAGDAGARAAELPHCAHALLVPHPIALSLELSLAWAPKYPLRPTKAPQGIRTGTRVKRIGPLTSLTEQKRLTHRRCPDSFCGRSSKDGAHRLGQGPRRGRREREIHGVPAGEKRGGVAGRPGVGVCLAAGGCGRARAPHPLREPARRASIRALTRSTARRSTWRTGGRARCAMTTRSMTSPTARSKVQTGAGEIQDHRGRTSSSSPCPTARSR